jgi:hypothetical protein
MVNEFLRACLIKKGIGVKNVLLFLTAFVVIGLFCVGCKKTPNELSQDTEEEYSQPSKGYTEDLFIRPGIGVGKIQFGMTVQQMKDILGEPDVTPLTGDKSHMYMALGIEIVTRDEATISTVICGNPSGMKEPPEFKAMEEACKFKTVEGIGIGSSEDQLLKAFGQPTERRGNTLKYKDKRMSISLTDGKVVGIYLYK